MSAETVHAMNAVVEQLTGVDAVYLCPHTSAERCGCRKPLPGLLLAAAADLDLDLRRSWLIGDRWVDVQAAQAAGVRDVLLDTPFSWLPTSAGPAPPRLAPLHRAPSLPACVQLILAETRPAPNRGLSPT